MKHFKIMKIFIAASLIFVMLTIGSLSCIMRFIVPQDDNRVLH